MTERIIQRQLRSLFGNYDYILFNTFMYAWESDFFAISKSGYSVEIEVKISKADFRKDFNKTDKHLLLTNHKKPAIVRSYRPFKPYLRACQTEYQYRPGDCSYVDFDCPADKIPNKFYYACPEGLLTVDDIPAYAGLIHIKATNKIIKCPYNGPDIIKPAFEAVEIKKAPILHRKMKDHSKSLLSKYYWKHKNDRVDVLTFLNSIERLNGELAALHKDSIEQIRNKFN